ncbi:MAG: hypothetical protein J6B43_05975 [Lachnospiraceae bacterium]|nr:hypothetical protein [Lachnospiraceae bacterium]
MNKKLIPYVMLFLAVVLLAVDIRIPFREYPAFEEFATEAPQTVNLVINHVIGHQLRLDLFSDVLGYLLLAAACVMLGMKNKHFIRQLPWIAVSLGFYLCLQLMPFSLNGGMRFRAGYLLYFVSGVLQVLILLRAMLHVCDGLDTTENHSFNNLSIIFMIISCFAGMVSVLIWFFDLFWISLVYLVLQLIFLGIFWYRIWSNRKLLVGEESA